jgi:hypothetical protein
MTVRSTNREGMRRRPQRVDAELSESLLQRGGCGDRLGRLGRAVALRVDERDRE